MEQDGVFKKKYSACSMFKLDPNCFNACVDTNSFIFAQEFYSYRSYWGHMGKGWGMQDDLCIGSGYK